MSTIYNVVGFLRHVENLSHQDRKLDISLQSIHVVRPLLATGGDKVKNSKQFQMSILSKVMK
jgi:hypothetical protein